MCYGFAMTFLAAAVMSPLLLPPRGVKLQGARSGWDVYSIVQLLLLLCNTYRQDGVKLGLEGPGLCDVIARGMRS